jgi:hypothetical protein
VHVKEGSLPDPLNESVAPQGSAGEAQGGVLSQDPAVELLKLGRWIHPQLVDEQLSRLR